MFSKTLQEMEENGLAQRTEYLEVPVRVEYGITDRVSSLIPILTQLNAWGAVNL